MGPPIPPVSQADEMNPGSTHREAEAGSSLSSVEWGEQRALPPARTRRPIGAPLHPHRIPTVVPPFGERRYYGGDTVGIRGYQPAVSQRMGRIMLIQRKQLKTDKVNVSHCRRRCKGVLPKSSTRRKVGRAVLCTPREFAKIGTFRIVSDPHGVQRTARPTPEPLGQHARKESLSTLPPTQRAASSQRPD